MKTNKYLFSILVILLFFGCKQRKESYEDMNNYEYTSQDDNYPEEEEDRSLLDEEEEDRSLLDEEEEEKEYRNGTYEAEVRGYNPNTGHEGVYTLDVEVEYGELTKIYWNNGGWLDDSHFSPTDIRDGYASFFDDRGYYYQIEILDKP